MIRFRKDVRPYNCFSNFYPCTVAVDGMQFRSAEAAFQAQKVPLEKRRDFIFCTPSAAKHLGRHVPLSGMKPCTKLFMPSFLRTRTFGKFYCPPKTKNLSKILPDGTTTSGATVRVLSASTSRDGTSSAKS